VNGRTPYFLLRRKKKKAKVKNLFILDEEKASWKKYSYELPLPGYKKQNDLNK
jgi:hypothetical protein